MPKTRTPHTGGGPAGFVAVEAGRARLVWDVARVALVPGAQRLVELEVEQVVELGTLAGSGSP